MPSEAQHWVSTLFLCEIEKGEPKIMEPGKCDEIAWFFWEDIPNLPLGVIMKENLKVINAHEQILFSRPTSHDEVVAGGQIKYQIIEW
jgi:hypothetical protein